MTASNQTDADSPGDAPAPDARPDTPRPRTVARQVVEAALAGPEGLEALGGWLADAADRGETADEIAGVADALRARMLPVRTRLRDVTDTCGTGGDGSGTFNISTAAAIVVAAAGVPVAKHGNRAVSSRTGSADVLEALGVRVDLAPDQAAECLETLGICFCLAPVHHPAMACVAAVRRALGRPTVFNLVGPLCNPATARVQVIGVGRRSARRALAEAAGLLGLRRALIVSGAIGGVDGSEPQGWLDEVSLFGPTDVLDVRDGACRGFRWTPETFGLVTQPVARFADLLADGPSASANAIRDVLAGGEGPRRDVVVLNAAALLWASATGDHATHARMAAEEAIDSGRAARLLESLARLSKSFPTTPA